MNHPSEFALLFKLPVEQRLQLAQDLWDSAVEDQAALPVPDWQLEELRRRAADYDAGKTSTRSWDDVKKMMATEVAARS